MTPVDRRRRGRAKRIALAVAAVLVTGAAVTAAAGFDAGLWDAERQEGPADALPPATEEVTRQTLVDTQTETGELGHGAPVDVLGKLAGTLTALPAVGTIVERGQALYRVDDTPVVLMIGSLPAYRVLAPDTEGADVEQFEANLAALGYRGFTVDDEYTAATATAVKAWQEDLGLPGTGVVERGRVVFAAGPVRVDGHEAAAGDTVGPDLVLLTYTGSTRLVTVPMDVADQRLAVAGAVVTVTLPDGRTVPGTVGGVRIVVDEGTGEPGGGEPATELEVTVTVADQDAVAAFDRAAVQVAFTAAQRENVLTVPVAALLALSEGGYGVEVVRGPRTEVVAVETGMFAAGRVEVSGSGLTEGLRVGVPS